MRLIAQDQNTPVSHAGTIWRSIEAASAKPEWITLTNHDAFAEPSWLSTLLPATRDNPKFDVFGSKLVKAVDPTLLDGAGEASAT